MVTPDLLVDLALLSSLSVLVHYFFGLYGIVAAVAGVSLLEHGAELAATALDKVSRYGGSKSEIAKKAVDSIRRRRPTRTRGANGDDVAWRNDYEVYENDREQPVDENNDDDEEDERRDADPRALLEQFSTVASDDYESESLDRTSQRDDVGLEDSSQSSDDLVSRLVIRDIGSCYTINEGSVHTETAADDQRTQDPDDPDRGDQPEDHQRQTSFVSAHTTTTTNNNSSLMQMNSREPTAFETDLFKGYVYFLVRTSPEDPHWSRLFSGRRRMFWIQVQGQFKRAPRGTVYLGGELPAQISPGIFTRSIAHVIMGIIQQLVGSVNFSFGDASNEVLPSIALPLFQSADQLIVTPAGQQPPPLGERDFGESDAARRLRRQTPVGSEAYVVGDTYSFDFHTMYVDLTRWRTANLPGLSEMELSTFFDSLPLRMVAYDVCATPSERHLQSQKDYLFKFEVQYDRRGRHSGDSNDVRTQRRRDPLLLLERAESGTSEDTMSVPEGVALSTDGSGGMSTVVSEVSSFDDQPLVLDEVLFLNQENARHMAKLSFSYLCWLEEVDVASGIRRVHYVFAVRRKRPVMEPEPGGIVQNQYQLAVVSAYALRVLLLGHTHKRKKQNQALKRMSTIKTGDDASELQLLSSLRFHSQSRIGNYSTISDEAFAVVQYLERLVRQKTQSFQGHEEDDDGEGGDTIESVVDNESNDRDFMTQLPASHLAADEDDAAFLSSLYRSLTQRSQLQAPQSTNASCSPSKLGVNLSKREREDMRVVFEGVVYRYHSESLLRQEVLFVTPDELLFYRSYSASAEKHVACGHVIGVQAIQLPAGPFEVDERCAFVFQVSTFAEEIVLCVGTEHARSTWMRVLTQHCEPQKNFDDALFRSERMHVCYASSKPLKPAGRIILNSRALFPQRQPAGDQSQQLPATTAEDALQVVKKALGLALQIHGRLGERVTVVETLAFLNAASALRTVDLNQTERELSHEAQLAFYLNLYHLVLAHAMISHGFPRGKSQWDFFLTHMCYSVGLHSQQQVSLSLADIEHVLLRKRMAQADLPHLSFSNLLHRNGLHIARLKDLGIAHPDFRLIFALAMNQQGQQDEPNSSSSSSVVIYEPELVHDQLNAVIQSALRDVAVEKSTTNGETIKILLPRVCEWYRLDFGGGGSPLHCVRKLLGFLSEELQHRVLDALEDPLATRVKFQSFKYAPKARLQHVELREGRLQPVAAAATTTTQ